MPSAGPPTSPSRPLLSTRAFPANPCADRYFAAGAIEECRVRLMSNLERGDGPALLIGAAGMGKSMLLAVLAESLADQFQIVHLSSTQLCTRRALLQAILHGLGLPYQKREEGELRLTLVEHLQDDSACPRGTLLLVDEAQALPVRLLEELRILSNLARDGEPLLRLVLAGSPALEEQFASTELESFNQRLAARCYLSAFNYQDTLQYVRAHLAVAGASPDELFDADALDSVYSASDGVPRLINQVCDRALVLAVDQGAKAVTQRIVQAAWSDLHQLPAPWHTPEPTLAEPESSVVEFGVLSESEVGVEFDEPIAPEVETHVAEVSRPAAPQLEASWDGSSEAEAELVEEESEPIVDESEPEGDYNADESLESIAFGFAPVGPHPLDEPTVPGESFDDPSPEPSPGEDALQTPDASQLFGDGYDDEEEVVFSKFSPLESVFTTSTPSVTNREDTRLSAEVGLHAIAGDETDELAASESHAGEPEEEASHSCLGGCGGCACDGAALQVFSINRDEALDEQHYEEKDETSHDSFFDVNNEAAEKSEHTGEDAEEDSEREVLVIERDEPAAEEPAAQRVEYRQLFSSLRR